MSGFVQAFKQAFTMQNAKLSYPTTSVFGSSTWIHPYFYIYYRAIMSFYTIAWIIAGGVRYEDDKWAVYLTNWSYLILTLYFFISLVLSVVHFMGNKPSAQDTIELVSSGTKLEDAESASPEKYTPLPLLYKICWVIYVIAIDAAVTVLILYWALVYDGTGVDGYNANNHAINAVLAVIEIAFGDWPFRMAHVYIPVLYGCVYILWSVIYWGAGGTVEGHTYIYKVLDYSEAPGSAVLYIVLIIPLFLPFVHSIVAGLHYARDRFLRSHSKK